MLVPACWLVASDCLVTKYQIQMAGRGSGKDKRDRSLGLGNFAQSKGMEREAELGVKAEPQGQVITGWFLLMPLMAHLISEVVTHDSSSPNNL